MCTQEKGKEHAGNRAHAPCVFLSVVTCISKVRFTYRSIIRLTILGRYVTSVQEKAPYDAEEERVQ
jgi:hypothetical protein